MLRYLIIIMLTITLLMLPVIIKFANGKAFQNDEGYPALMLTLGNIGQNEPICFSQFLGIDQSFKQKCTRGKISKIKFKGLIPDSSNKEKTKDKKSEQLLFSEINDFCGSYTEDHE